MSVPDQPTRLAIEEERGLPWHLPIARVGPVIEVTFPAAAAARDIPHGLDGVPDGYFIVLQSGGVVTATQVTSWTRDIAWMTASATNTRARLCFYTLLEGALTRVVPS